ncbi:MAG TPA: hypothetical protein VNO19_00655 [Gemmatimonadales bacterium]|nr:hypothetical protein [Gemmatimonadales bacterium]
MSGTLWLAAGTAGLVLACGPRAPSDRPAATSQEKPQTKPPADVSHGEAPIGSLGGEGGAGPQAHLDMAVNLDKRLATK